MSTTALTETGAAIVLYREPQSGAMRRGRAEADHSRAGRLKPETVVSSSGASRDRRKI